MLRDLKDNLARTILSVLSIAVGVIAFGGLSIARNAIGDNLNTAYRASNPTDITLDLSPFDDALTRWVAAQPGVHSATSSSNVAGTMTRADGRVFDVNLIARGDYEKAGVNILEPSSGAYPPTRGGFLLERGSVNAAGMKVGDAVRLQLATDAIYTLHNDGVLYDVSTLAGPAATRLTMFIADRTLSDLGLNTQHTRLLVRSTPGTRVADKYALADSLKADLQQRGLQVRGVSVNERSEHWAASTVDGILLILVVVGAVSLIMSGFLIINVVMGLLQQQRKIIGIMKIIGGDRGQIFGIYLVLVLCLGLLALLVAMPLSIALGGMVTRLLAGLLNFNVTQSGVNASIVLLEVGMSLITPMLFAAIPIWNALRVSPAEAITEVLPRQQTSLLERVLVKLEALPRQLLMAFRNIFRNPTRLTMTALTLTVAGTLFTGIMNLRIGMPASMERNTGTNSASTTISFGGPIDRVSAVNRALMVPGVSQAEGWISSAGTVVRDGAIEGSTLQLFGGSATSPFVNPPMTTGRWLAPYSAETRNEIVVSRNLPDSEPNLGIGSVVTLKRGNTEHAFTIVGMFSAGPGGILAYGQYETIGRFAGQQEMATSVRVRTAGEDALSVRTITNQLRDLFEARGVQVVNAQSRIELINQVVTAFDTIITLLIIVAILVAVVGGLGLASTMSLNVMERTREVGVMRSVGAESGDLRFMFIFEGLSIGLISALIAFVLSMPATTMLSQVLGNAMRFGAFLVQVNPLGYLYWVIIVSTVSIVASLAPARRASQISIREALAYT